MIPGTRWVRLTNPTRRDSARIRLHSTQTQKSATSISYREKAARRRLVIQLIDRGSGGKQLWLLCLLTMGHEADASEAEKQHGPRRGFGDGSYLPGTRGRGVHVCIS